MQNIEQNSFHNLKNLAPLNLDEDIGPSFCVTVDTEEEFDWSLEFAAKGSATKAANRLNRFQDFCINYGVRPTYYIDYPIVQDDRAVQNLSRFIEHGGASIGLHLHPWVTPPVKEEINAQNSYAGNLPAELEEQKFDTMCTSIYERLGVKPISYRAGRFGIGPNTVPILKKYGISIDTSVRSHYDYSRQYGPDFSQYGPRPFWLDEEQEILEIPITTIFTGPLRFHGAPLHHWAEGNWIKENLINRTGLVQRIPFTPEGTTSGEIKEAIDIALDDGLKLLNFYFHSPSLEPANTPYVRNAADLNHFFSWWREAFDHLSKRGVAPANLDEIGRTIWQREREKKADEGGASL